MIIYKITNTVTGKIYIGQTIIALKTRWALHCNLNKPYCRRLSNSIKKHGVDNFKIEQIAEASSLEELNLLEIKLIKEYNSLSPNGYNLMTGGGNKRHHPETKWSEILKQIDEFV